MYGKLIDKTLADYDYPEISQALYGRTYAPDVARRMLYGEKRIFQILESEHADIMSESKILGEYEAAKLELMKETKRFQDQRREFNKLLTKDARREHLWEHLMDCADNLNNSVGDIFKNRRIPEDTSDKEAVLVFSDWHYGMTADNLFNYYDTSECRDRVARTVDEAIERIKLHKVKTLHIFVLGDLIHGAIHTSARVCSEEAACEQLMDATEILAQAINELSAYVKNVNVFTTYGNHARTVQDKKDSVHTDNIERLVPWWLEQRFKDSGNIKIMGDKVNEFLYGSVCGFGVCASHGDLDDLRGSAKTLPALLKRAYGVDVDYVLLGDKHHRASFEDMGVTCIQVGSLCGTDDYANDKRLFSNPSQLLLIFGNRGLDAEYRLRCS